MNGEPKQVIVMRKDLGMRKGKMIAQGAHASMKPILEAMRKENIPQAMQEWLNGRFKKVVVYVESEEDLLLIHVRAMNAGLPAALIQDQGLTEFKEPTYTAVAVGPAYPEEVDKITGELPLL